MLWIVTASHQWFTCFESVFLIQLNEMWWYKQDSDTCFHFRLKKCTLCTAGLFYNLLQFINSTRSSLRCTFYTEITICHNLSGSQNMFKCNKNIIIYIPSMTITRQHPRLIRSLSSLCNRGLNIYVFGFDVTRMQLLCSFMFFAKLEGLIFHISCSGVCNVYQVLVFLLWICNGVYLSLGIFTFNLLNLNMSRGYFKVHACNILPHLWRREYSSWKLSSLLRAYVQDFRIYPEYSARNAWANSICTHQQVVELSCSRIVLFKMHYG